MVARLLCLSAVLALANAAKGTPEWSAAFSLADKEHKWIMQKVGGAYADPKMWLVMLPTSNPTKQEAEDKKDAMMSHFDFDSTAGGHDGHDHRRLAEARKLAAGGGCVEKTQGQELHPKATGSCFMLVVNEGASDTTWPVDTSGLTGVLMYAQHVPTEFERDMHFFKDSKGEDIEPAEYPKRWGEAIGAAFLVNLMTLCGVVLMIPAVNNLYKNDTAFYGVCMFSFAAGALISAAFYLMLFEGSHYVAIGATSESETAFLWGTMVLVGVITASVIDTITEAVMPKGETSTAPKDAEAGKGGLADIAIGKSAIRIRSGVLVGDFMHNLCDGIFIGTAFTACSSSLAWNITVATIAHEIAQEISDFVVLTDPNLGNLTTLQALGLNFLSGLSVILGVIIIMSMSEMDGRAIGMILTFGGGIYIQIGLGECMASVYKLAQTIKLRCVSMLFFCIGAIAIGLVLLDHKHCETGGHDHGGH